MSNYENNFYSEEENIERMHAKKILDKYPVVIIPYDFQSNNFLKIDIDVPPNPHVHSNLKYHYNLIRPIHDPIEDNGMLWGCTFVPLIGFSILFFGGWYYNDDLSYWPGFIIFAFAFGYVINIMEQQDKQRSKKYESQSNAYYGKLERIKSEYDFKSDIKNNIKSMRNSNPPNRISILVEKDKLFDLKFHDSSFNKKGVSEENFFLVLSEAILNSDAPSINHDEVKILRNIEWCGYTPDFLIRMNTYNIRLIIEIDEPYTLNEKEPIHLDDEFRDKTFIESNFGVIRFSEKQIITESDLCCHIIINALILMQGKSFANEAYLKSINQLFKDGWDKKQAIDWAEIGYRESYLGIPKVKKVEEEISVAEVLAQILGGKD